MEDMILELNNGPGPEKESKPLSVLTSTEK